MQHLNKKAFTLVELAIVLVIIGLLTAGVVGGQSLIESAKLNSALTQMNQLQTATNAFKLEYGGIPGDFKDATLYWGKNATNCNTHTGTAATPGTCNGDGNKKIDDGSWLATTSEFYKYPQHLQLAGLLEGSYTGITNSTTDIATSATPDTGNTIKIAGFGDGFIGLRFFGPNVWNFYREGNFLVSWGMTPYVLPYTPKNAFNIDKKIDDGIPGIGLITSQAVVGCTTTQLKETALYDLSSKDKTCTIYYPTGN